MPRWLASRGPDAYHRAIVLTVRRAAPLLLAAWILVGAGTAGAQVEVLTADRVARLDAAKQKPLTLNNSGDATRFQSTDDEEWEEAGPPLILDVNRDGLRDFVVFRLGSERTDSRALLIHEWGEAPDVFGPAVFYLIVGAEGDVTEWAGKHQLLPRTAPRPAGLPPAGDAAPPKD